MFTVRFLGIFGVFCSPPILAAPLVIDSDESWVSLVPGEWPKPPKLPLLDPVTESSFVLNNLPVMEQKEGSLFTNLGGFILDDIEGNQLTFSMGNHFLEAAPHLQAPFEPSVPGDSKDNFGAAMLGIDAAVRDAVIELEGTIQIGQPADLRFTFSEGRMDYRDLVSVDSIPLSDLVGTENISEKPVSATPDGKIIVAVRVAEEFQICLDEPCPPNNNSRLMFDALLTARPAMPGDATLDGRVAFDDFLILSEHFNQQGDWRDGDFDGDGQVGFSDFLKLSAKFGSASVTAAVPEPYTLQLVCLSLVVLFIVRRKRMPY